jgi:hypothetical protein
MRNLVIIFTFVLFTFPKNYHEENEHIFSVSVFKTFQQVLKCNIATAIIWRLQISTTHLTQKAFIENIDFLVKMSLIVIYI